MRARDVMTMPVITVGPDAPVGEIAKLLMKHRISAVPVTGPELRLVGIVSEGDLMRRVESGTERRPSWCWLDLGMLMRWHGSTQSRADDVRPMS